MKHKSPHRPPNSTTAIPPTPAPIASASARLQHLALRLSARDDHAFGPSGPDAEARLARLRHLAAVSSR